MEWSAARQAGAGFPEIIKALEGKLLTGELDPQRQQCMAINHEDFICEADTLGSHGYVYVAIYVVANNDAADVIQASL